MKVRDVVLLHGWGYSADIWKDLADRLAPRLRAHVPDLPGYGDAHGRPSAEIDVLADAMARIAPKRCHVVGWSLGGEVALAWALRVPRQVQKLVLVSATPCFARRPGWPCATHPDVLQAFGRSVREDRPGTLGRFVGASAKGDSRARRVAGALDRALDREATEDTLAAGLEALARTDLRRELRALAQPALILHGARDRIVPPAAGRRLAAMMKRARFSLLRSCAHAPFLAQPARVARELREFLDE